MISRRVSHAICATLVVLAAGAEARQASQAPTAQAPTPQAPAPQAQAPQARMTEVERLTSEGEWDRARALLTEIITELSSGERTADTDATLILAYERRAMAQLQMGDEANARLDFAALLNLNPNHALASASPGVAALFAAVRKSSLGLLDLTVRPVDATVTLERDDPTPAEAGPRTVSTGSIWLRPGVYRVTAKRPGHEPLTHSFTASPGSTERRALALPRTSVALFISTTPPGVRVLVDGEPRGVTEAAPGGGASAVLVIDGLVPRDTPYKLRFEKECFVPAGETFLVESLDAQVGTGGPDPNKIALDRTYDPVLRPAFGQLQVVADQPDAAVWIDGQVRGSAAQAVADVCEGAHDVDVRGPAGTFAKKVTIEYGKTTRLPAPLVPTFALISPAAQGAALDRELNARLADAFRASSAVRLVSADSSTVESLAAKDASAIAKRLEVQGTATARRVPPDAEGHDVELSLTAAGSTRADIVRLRVEDGASVERVVKRLDAMLPVSRRSIGVDVMDVLRLDGAVVSAVDPNGPANGLIKPGDVIVGLGPEPVATAEDLSRVLVRSTGTAVNVRVRERGDVIPVNVTMRPAILGMSEPGVLYNEAIVELRARLARLRAEGPAADQAEADRLRLNLAVALMAVEGWGEAETLLSGLGADPQKGIRAGTLQYLRGLAAKGLGRTADARAYFTRAAADGEAMLTDHGPLVAYLAKAELRAGPSGSQRP